MTATITTLSQRRQCGHNSLEDGASRYDQSGQLWVRHNSEWMSHQRFVAARWLERQGHRLAQGTRVELIDNARPAVPSNLTVKARGRARLTLKEYARAS